MNTAEINAQRLAAALDFIATEIAFLRERIAARPPRLVAIGRSVAGSGFVVTTGGIATTHAPLDFAEAVAEVDSKPVPTWPAAVHDEIDNEQVGAEIAAQPWLY